MADVNLLQLSALAKTSITSKTIRWVPVETSTTPPTPDSAPLRLSLDELNKSMLDTVYPLTVTSGTLTSSAPALAVTQTWDNVATTFVGLSLSVTNTTSAAGSKLLDLQVGGAVALSVKPPISSTVSVSTDSDNLQLISGIRIYLNGDRIGTKSTTQLDLASTSTLAWTSTTSITAAEDTILLRDAANTLAMRNSTNAQAFQLYNTYTSGSVYERAFMRWATNVLTIGTEHIGSTGRDIHFYTAGSPRLYIGQAGGVSVDSGGTWFWQSRSLMKSPADGQITFQNFAATGFDLLQFGGTTSSFPALKRNTTTLECKLANDSAYTAFKALTLEATTSMIVPSITFGSSTILYEEIANAVAFQNSTNAQSLYIYNTYTSGSVYERGFVRFVSNVFEVGTEEVGSTSRDLALKTNNVARITMDGTSGAITMSAATTINANLTFGDGNNIICSSVTTGTQIATATGQKLGFWGATPVVQQVLATGAGATVDNVISALQTLGLFKQS